MNYAKLKKEKLILKKHGHKEMFNLFRRTLTTISNIELNELQISVDAKFGRVDFSFHITTYDYSGDNRTYTAYDFGDIERQKKDIAALIKIIREDDFKKIMSSELFDPFRGV